jgi:hypothetical protein
LLGVGLDGLHEVEADLVEDGDTGDASLVDGTSGAVGSSSGGSNAEGPAGLIDLLSALTNALPELILTPRGILALGVLVLTLLLEALLKGWGLGEDQGEEEAEDNKSFHLFGNIVID